MNSNSPQITVDVPSGGSATNSDESNKNKTHIAKTKSISSLISSKSSSLLSSSQQQQQLLAKKSTVTSFKVEAEIVNTDSTKNVSLFDNTDSLNNGSLSYKDNLSSIMNDLSSGMHLSGLDSNNQNQNSDSEETFVYDTQKQLESFNLEDTRSITEGERPILVHKNSVRSSFMVNHNNAQPRAFSQTVLPDNESITSKKLISQRRVPTLQQPQQQSIQLLQPSRFASKTAHYQHSISSRSQVHLALPNARNVYESSDSHTQTNSDDSDQGSFISGPSYSDSGEEVVDTEEGADDTNTTLKLNKSYVSSPLRSFVDSKSPNRHNSKSPVKNASTRNMIISQVRNVSKHLFENEKNYSKKKLSFESLKEDDERSLLLHHPHDMSDDEYPFYLNNNNNKNKNNHNMHENYGGHWNSNFNVDRGPLNRNNNSNEDVYYYRTYDAINPHNYVSKYKKQNIILKFLSLLLRTVIVGIIFISITKVFIITYITNPIINFEIANLEKLIIAENLLIFDVDCTCTNINLQDVSIKEGDIDVFITYTNDENVERTLLLGSISNFFVPLKFNGLLNSENVPLSKIFSGSYARNLTMSSKGQLKLSGDFKDLNEDIDLILSKSFFMDIRGSFKYKLPFSSSEELISVSKKYKNKDESI